jgi:pyruvate/2-oxoglutarate dehydrogenase complex dihydrolipoamide dehydrogenase (E3) component
VPERYDVIVIGAGPAGEVAASRLPKLGLRTALVERELVGGQCAYWACIPSKTLLHLGTRASEVRSENGRGLLRFEDGSELSDEQLLVATGREPRVDGLGLENLDVEVGPGGNRSRRALPRRRGGLGDRRRDRCHAIHACRQVPGANRLRRHRR